jgi:hypothetical protein
MNGKFCSSEVMMKDRLSTNLKMKRLENEISETVVYMASCRNDRGRDLVKKNCPFRNKGEEKLEAERED